MFKINLRSLFQVTWEAILLFQQGGDMKLYKDPFSHPGAGGPGQGDALWEAVELVRGAFW